MSTVIASPPNQARYRTRTMNRDFVTASVARQSMQPGSHGLLHFVRNDSALSQPSFFGQEGEQVKTAKDIKS